MAYLSTYLVLCGLHIRKPLDMATGNMFHVVSEDKAREFITDLLRVKGDPDPEEEEDQSEFDDAAGGEPVVDRRQVEDRDTKQKEFGDIFLNLSALVKVLNSHKTKVNVLRYKELSMETYKLIVTAFPWCHVPESIHRVLGHAWERIEGNDSFGLGSGTKIQ